MKPGIATRKKRRFYQRLIRAYGLFALGVVGAYGVIAVFHPGFFAHTLTHLSQALADDDIVVTATVLDAPQAPVVTGEAVCSAEGVLSVSLDWATDPNSYTYDVSRDGSPLVSGLTGSEYDDTAVTAGGTYSYVVRANGPMGPGYADSAPVNVSLPLDCEATLPAASVALTSLAGKPVGGAGTEVRTTERRPSFRGTTNMPGGLIRIVISGKSSLIAHLTATSTGYWEWRPPQAFGLGQHTLTVTATDPDDADRTVQARYRFRIQKTESGTDAEEAPVGSDEAAPLPVVEADFRLALQGGPKFYQGSSIPYTLTVIALDPRYREQLLSVRYTLEDEEGKAVATLETEEILRPGRTLTGAIPIPLYAGAGRYALRADVSLGNVNVSRQVPIDIEALPLIRLGSDRQITYDEFMRHIGTLVLASLFLLVLWGFVFLWEYVLFRQGDRAVDEGDMRQAGYFTRKS